MDRAAGMALILRYLGLKHSSDLPWRNPLTVPGINDPPVLAGKVQRLFSSKIGPMSLFGKASVSSVALRSEPFSIEPTCPVGSGRAFAV